MAIFGSYIIDDIFFIISSLLIVLYFCSLKIKKKEKIVYSLLFIIFNSSYNSHFVNVTNYNLVTMRTFIWAYKVIWKFTILDFICIFIILFNVMLIPKILKKSKITRCFFIGDIALLVLGTLSYLMWNSYSVDQFANFIVCIKALVYALSFMILFNKYIKTPINIIKPMIIILFLGFLSMALSPLSIGIKIRYGIISVVSDQEDMNTILLFAVLYMTIYYIVKIMNHKISFRIENILILLGTIFIMLQLFFCFSKAAIIIFILCFGLFLYFYNRKTTGLIFTCFCLLPIGVVLFKEKIVEMFTSTAINTRFFQLYDCLDYMNTLSPLSKFTGIGIGGPYYSTRITGDLGEIKTVDLNKYGVHWKFSVQTPIISVFKDVGLLGVLIFVVNRIMAISYLIKIIRKETSVMQFNSINIEIIVIVLFLIPTCLTVYFFHSTMIPVVIFHLFLLRRLDICLKIQNEKKEKQNVQCNVCCNS